MASAVRPDMDGMGLPLVDIFVRRFDKGGSTSFRVESAITAISRSKLERLGIGGKDVVRKIWMSKMGVVRC